MQVDSKTCFILLNARLRGGPKDPLREVKTSGGKMAGSKIHNFGVNDTFVRNFYDTNFSREFLHYSNWILISTRSLLQPSVQPSTFAWFSRAKEWCFDNCRRFYQPQGVLVMAPVIWSQTIGGSKQIAAGSQSINLQWTNWGMFSLHPVDTPCWVDPYSLNGARIFHSSTSFAARWKDDSWLRWFLQAKEAIYVSYEFSCSAVCELFVSYRMDTLQETNISIC